MNTPQCYILFPCEKICYIVLSLPQWHGTGTLHLHEHSCDCSQPFAVISFSQKVFCWFICFVFIVSYSAAACFPLLGKLIPPSMFQVYCWRVVYCNICQNLVVNSHFDRQLSSFQVLAMANSIAMNTCTCFDFFW